MKFNVVRYNKISNDLERAIILATEMHAGQTDKSGIAYISHVARVACQSLGEKQQIVGWLHDVVEDTDVTVLGIKMLFDDEIAEAVDAISRRAGEPWMAYGKRIKQNRLARRVKICDLWDNLRRDRAPGNPSLEKNRKMYWQMLAYLDAKSVTQL